MSLHVYLNTAAYLARHTKDLGVQRCPGGVVGLTHCAASGLGQQRRPARAAQV